MEYRINHFKLDKYFDEYITSGFIGITKPNKEIYLYLLRKTKEIPQNILFIDDNIENLNVGKTLGFHTHKFNEIWPPLD